MSEPRVSLSLKVESFVSGIVRFVNRYARTGWLAVWRPSSFNHRLGRSIRKKRIVPPLTFLIVGCFLFSVIIDTYAEGWIVYFNWIWLDEEISKKIQERGGDLFSLTAIVRSGLPTFLAFAVLIQTIAWLISKPRWLRPRVTATLSYAFGLHASAFAIACFLPIIGIYALNPETSDSFVSNLWQYGMAYLVLGLTIFFGLVAFLSPILLIIWAAHPREARRWNKPVWVRSIAAVPVFLLTIFLVTELGSVPARFTSALTQTPMVEYQVMGEFKLLGDGPGDVSGVASAVMFHNKTGDLAYIDASNPITGVTITGSDGSEIPLTNNPKTLVFDENRVETSILAILPGMAQLVYFEVSWELGETLGDPTSEYDDGSWWYDGVEIKLSYDPLSGADLASDMDVELTNPTVHPRP